MTRVHPRGTALQLGLLASIGLAFVVGNTQRFAEAGGGPICVDESMCSFKRPNVMFIVDYSTSMNTIWDLQNDSTRWEIVVAQLGQVTAPGSFLSQNTPLHCCALDTIRRPELQGPRSPMRRRGSWTGKRSTSRGTTPITSTSTVLGRQSATLSRPCRRP